MSPVVRSFIIVCFLFQFAGCSPPATISSTIVAAPQTVKTHRETAVAATQTIAATEPVADVFPTTTDPRDTVRFLASDALAGRLPGTPGLHRAGDFLASELARIGLQPLPGQADYFQTFSMADSSALAPSTHLVINGEKLVANKDFAPMSVSAEKQFTGKVIFTGFSIMRDAPQYDDFAGQDLHGKIVLAMMKEPLDEKGVSRLAGGQGHWSNSALFIAKAKAAADHGAVALLLVAPPSSGGLDAVNPYAGDVRTPSTIPVLQITRRAANLLLSMGGAQDLKTLQDEIYATFKPHSCDLADLEVGGEVTILRTSTSVRNVMAYLPGIGPHADEWVVIGAHYDHLGQGQMGHMVGGRTGSIWHGADDNASGTAAVLELAQKMKQAGPLPRSVLFIFFTAEEEGLIGSDHFVKNPLIPLDKTVAMLNLDMVGRLRSNALQIGGAGTAANLDSIVKSAVEGTPLTTSTALPDDGGRGGLGPSDHMSFAEHKIPVLFLFTGMHADYHRPTDTADKINFAGIDLLVDVSQRIITAMATMPRQTYDDSNDSNSMTRMMPGGGGHRAVLGIVPDDSSSATAAGVPISGVVPGGPADTAGFKAGDTIITFNGKSMKTLGDLSEMLDEGKAGDKAIVKVMRDGKPVELHPLLRER